MKCRTNLMKVKKHNFNTYEVLGLCFFSVLKNCSLEVLILETMFSEFATSDSLENVIG
ncbi:hypothetical protein [Clostridium gasigenes]|uniref:Uncharacterized protein n=1 Tax=Clostridium gasigenes TaxID=94869 RepID=A0A7X0VQA8_9CLOT|nr:hypothetical protein [Clostridium gasigenes]MBB6714104.1 hypothetical protein [Clostridium gasigenes]